MADRADETTFTSRQIRRSKAAGCVISIGITIFLLSQMAKNPTPLVKVYMAILSVVALGLVVCLVRAFRVGIVLTADGVVTRTTFSTKSFAWDDIDGALAKDRPPMATGRNFVASFQPQSHERVQIIPQLRLTSGKVVRLYGLQITIASPMTPNFIDEAISEINSRLEARRGALGS